MAGKEAVFLLIDVGAHMHEQIQCIDGSTQNRLEVATDCIKEFVQQKLFNSKQTYIGVILFGIDPEEDGDDNTSYVQEIEKPDYNLVRNIMELKNHEVPKRQGGDLFDALDKTIATIDEYVGKKKFTKTIFAFTSGAGQSDYNEARLKGLIRNAKSADVKINITGLDFMSEYFPGQDLENEELEESENQTSVQNLNQEMLVQMIKEIPLNIEVYPASLAMDMYKQFKTKQTTTRVSFRGTFQITSDLIINIELYKKSNELKLPSLKKYHKTDDFNPNINAGTIQKETIDFLQEDPQQEPIDPEEVIKGFYYGRQLVPITKTFEEEMKYKTQKGLTLLGFTEKSNINRHFFMKDVECLIPVQEERSQQALAALIKSCYQTKRVAIIRYCYRETTAPRLCALYPHFASNYECFYMAELPTAESIRDYQFNSLKPSTEDQQQAIGQLIDNMDLMNVEDEDGEKDEALQIKNIFNPTRQYFFQTVMHRAFQQNQNLEQDNGQLGKEEGLPEVNKTINNYLRPEEKIYKKAEKDLEKIKELFTLEERDIGKDLDRKVFWKDLINKDKNKDNQIQIEEQDLENLENQEENQEEIQQVKDKINDIKKGKFAFDDEEEIVKVSDLTPIEDFRKMVSNKKEDLVDKAIKQMSEVIIKLIENSFNGSLYKKSLQCLKELRKSCIKEDEVESFNEFLQKLKKNYGEDKKNQNQKFWQFVIQEGITLIMDSENNKSKVSLQDARQFIEDNNKIVQQYQPQQKKKESEYNELEDEID